MFLLTRPAQTLTGIPGTIQSDITIPTSTTAVVDSLTEADNHAVKWIVNIVDNTNSKIRSYEILANNNFGVDVKFNKYSIIGDIIDHNVDVQINLGNIELKITNNELNSLEIHVVRIQVIHA